jgi:hypothetical protein
MARGSIRLARWTSPRVSGRTAASGRCIVGCWYAVSCGRYQLLDPSEGLMPLSGWLWHSCHLSHGLGQVLLSVREQWGCPQNIIVSLAAPSCILLLKLTLEFPIFIC